MAERQEQTPFTWIEEIDGKPCNAVRRKRRARPRKLEYIGWGSKILIEFLESLGKDVSKQLSQYDVAAIVNEYVSDNNLLHPSKKKRIICDERLHYLFGKKIVSRIKVHDMLSPHFADNEDDSDDPLLSSDDDRNVSIKNEKEKVLLLERISHPKKKVSETPKSCFAAIIPENIKLIYLKRSLVQDLLKDHENFDGKVIGSFVRIKCDPNDYLQKNSHQLTQVTGVKEIVGAGNGNPDILLQVSNAIGDISIKKLSEENFSEEECEDLRQKVKDGLFKRLTVEEVEQKACTLHEDITKHWLVKELALLQFRIDRANEKGWRREIERRQLLQTPSKQEELLHELPVVIAEELEQEATPLESVDNVVKEVTECGNQGSSNSSRSILVTTPEIPMISTEMAAKCRDVPVTVQESNSSSPKSILREDTEIPGDNRAANVSATAEISCKVASSENVAFVSGRGQPRAPNECTDKNNGEAQLENAKQIECSTAMQKKVIIELSDDDNDDVEDAATRNTGLVFGDVNSLVWHYIDPQGVVQGPFTIAALKHWSDEDYFPPDFKIWKTGQQPDEAVLLTDILKKHMFPNFYIY